MLPFDDVLGKMIRGGIDGAYPDLQINHGAVQISGGKLDGPLNLTFEMAGDEAVLTREISPQISRTSSPDDILHFVLVNDAKESTMVFEQKALRGDLSLRLALPAKFWKDELHGFFFFVNHNGKDASATTYRNYVQ
ncbi:hypothetical protein ADIARSV_2641 [Arcticibacter svalbardensis MN12-7]|uniref:Uncharacterized protein n=1 Tax=Arcticibacter svalbardensis MN12-7 TaxID=1150600 RepID=R9GRR9_9SPHI|nr:hypothetical protein ADIARSV_2641 [Arcticibacter svalbardensis MN12-7]